MRMLLSMVGIPDMPTLHMITLIALAVTSAIMLGWLADGILGDGGFGLVLNGVLLLAGAVIGAIVWRRTGYNVSIGQPAATALAAASSALTTLVLAGTIRRLV
jgi:hypothetical protein